jgi:hypothetical protein
VHQQAFDDVKAAIAKEVTLAYPDYSEEFEIYTDGSNRNSLVLSLLKRTGRLLSSVKNYLKLSKNKALLKLNSWP